MKKTGGLWKKTTVRRVVSAILSLVLLFGMAPSALTTAEAADWMEEYIQKAVDWGVMRGDIGGNLNADKTITRAEFVAMVNRAFGYRADTTHPFTDVSTRDWFNNDIGMGYNMGYFKGTSDTTASPNSSLTREQAVVLIGRNLLLDEKLGEALGFSDSRSFSEWSRGMVESAIGAGFAGGYSDGTFQPQRKITRGEVAAMLVKAIGTMVNTSGTHSLGGVYGNVMVSTSGVKLKNTTIAGNLYITGGLELGDVLLENVEVLGKIIVSGAGESHKGDSSIILRNVKSGELVVDSLMNQFVTLRAEGDTQIDFTNVKTSAFMDDQTAVGDGLLYVEMNGEAGMTVTMAGNIEEVINCTPESVLTIAEGTAQSVTMDEKAVESTLDIKNIASIEELNLDVGTNVTGEGDVKDIYINAPGSTVQMLPDKIDIRPGLTANINGEEMDTKAGEESSAEPRILAGYPKIKNIAPTSAEAVFSTNKKGTIHWALTSLIDGPVSVDDLLEKKDYNDKILQQGTINVTSSDKEFKVKISKLISDGSYYVSAVLVDSRDQKSPVKYITFTTPDGTAPTFASGYPELTKITMNDAQVAVMPTKSSRLYYAVLPKGAGTPSIAEFKSDAISGDLGTCPDGGIPVTKNVIDFAMISALRDEEGEYVKGENGETIGKLEELKSYELYLCLIDPDNGKDSGVKKISFTTVDGTPPELNEGMVTGIQKNGVNLTTSMNEVGTIYWVVVPAGTEYLPEGMVFTGEESRSYSSDNPEIMKKAILQVVNGMGGILKAGKANAKANSDVTLKVNGLQPESTYDVYYVAQDKAGNYSEIIRRNTVNTLDDAAPKARQEFTRTADEAGKNPLPETDIRIIFNELVRREDSDSTFLDQYTKAMSLEGNDRDAVLAALAAELERSIQFWDVSNKGNAYQIMQVTGEDSKTGTWIDYTKVELEMNDFEELVITFRNGEAINLGSGNTYQFVLEDITDVSDVENPMKPNPTKLDEFTTVFAQVNLTSKGMSIASGNPLQRDIEGNIKVNEEDGKPVPARIDMQFWMTPQSTKNVNDNVDYDIWFESTQTISFDIYARATDVKGKVITDANELSMFSDSADFKTNINNNSGWIYLGEMDLFTTGDKLVRGSVNGLIQENFDTTKMSPLNSLRDNYIYEFAIEVTGFGTDTGYGSWSEKAVLGVVVPAGQTLVSPEAINPDPWNDDITNIAFPDDFKISRQFIDTLTPRFEDVRLEAGDGVVSMELKLDRAGTVYYVLAPVDKVGDRYSPHVTTTMDDGNGVPVEFNEWFELDKTPPLDGSAITKDNPMGNCPTLLSPTNKSVAQMVDEGTDSLDIMADEFRMGTTKRTVTVDGLKPNTLYLAYFVLSGESQELSETYCFQFTTQDVTTPKIELNLANGNSAVIVKTSTPSELNWAVYTYDMAAKIFSDSFMNYIDKSRADSYRQKCKDRGLVAKLADAEKVTVIQALLTSLSATDNKSLFDEYANDYIRQSVLEFVQMEASTSYSPTETGDVTLRYANTPQTVTPANLSPETTYYFITVARHTMGQAYAFKAIGGLRKADGIAPDLLDNSTFLYTYASNVPKEGEKYNYNVDWNVVGATPARYAYKGSVTLEFSEEIYQLLTNADLSTTLNPIKTGDAFKNAVSVVGGDLAIKNVKVSKGTITFDFVHATVGSTITIFNSGSLSDAYSNVSGQGARLVLKFVVDGESGFLGSLANPRFEINWVKGK